MNDRVNEDRSQDGNPLRRLHPRPGGQRPDLNWIGDLVKWTSVGGAIRETLLLIRDMMREDGRGCTLSVPEIARLLELDQRTVYGRLQQAKEMWLLVTRRRGDTSAERWAVRPRWLDVARHIGLYRMGWKELSFEKPSVARWEHLRPDTHVQGPPETHVQAPPETHVQGPPETHVQGRRGSLGGGPRGGGVRGGGLHESVHRTDGCDDGQLPGRTADTAAGEADPSSSPPAADTADSDDLDPVSNGPDSTSGSKAPGEDEGEATAERSAIVPRGEPSRSNEKMQRRQADDDGEDLPPRPIPLSEDEAAKERERQAREKRRLRTEREEERLKHLPQMRASALEGPVVDPPATSQRETPTCFGKLNLEEEHPCDECAVASDCQIHMLGLAGRSPAFAIWQEDDERDGQAAVSAGR